MPVRRMRLFNTVLREKIVMTSRFGGIGLRGAMLLAAGLMVVTVGGRASAQSAAVSAPGGLETVAVVVDHAKVIRLPERTQTVIVGNPAIADVSVQRNGVLVITGKSFGVTNLIALDAAGAMLAESRVSVRAQSEALVTVHRGMDRESYACAPHCQPSVQLGDSTKFFGDVGGQAASRNQLAQPQR
jgi:hypothetical protein